MQEAPQLLQSTVTSVNNERGQKKENEHQSDHEQLLAESVMTDMSIRYISQLEEEVQRICEENQQLQNAFEFERILNSALHQM